MTRYSFPSQEGGFSNNRGKKQHKNRVYSSLIKLRAVLEMFACSHLFKWIVITQSEMCCFVGVRPRPAWAWSPGQLGHGRWLGTGAPWSAPSPVTSDITRGNRSADTRHTVTRSHTHAVKHTRTQSVRWGWGHWSAQYTGQRRRGCENRVTGDECLLCAPLRKEIEEN